MKDHVRLIMRFIIRSLLVLKSDFRLASVSGWVHGGRSVDGRWSSSIIVAELCDPSLCVLFTLKPTVSLNRNSQWGMIHQTIS